MTVRSTVRDTVRLKMKITMRIEISMPTTQMNGRALKIDINPGVDAVVSGDWDTGTGVAD